MSKHKVVAITVTYNRTNTLINTIKALLNQKEYLDKIIIVDNGSDQEHKTKLMDIEKIDPKIEIIWLGENLGGAGGFYYGMKSALANDNPDFYWIMDDDAYPQENCLKNLIEAYECMEVEQVGYLAPAIYGIDFKQFQMYHHKIISKNKIKDIIAVQKYEDLKKVTKIEANAFVGVLITKESVSLIGLPDKDLFIYGDDTEYTYRISRVLNGYLIKDAIINHQDLIKKDGVVLPTSWWKDYYMYRNRFLFIKKYSDGLIKKIIGEILLIGVILKNIMATLIKKEYKGLKKVRVSILVKSIFDGILNKNGVRIIPQEYIKKINVLTKVE